MENHDDEQSLLIKACRLGDSNKSSRNGMHHMIQMVLMSSMLFGTSLSAAHPPQGPNRPIRVALMKFTADDNSYRSSQAAADLAAVLQAELSSEHDIQWVERAELQTAERELELSELGLPDAVGSLRRGKFTAADWIVTGHFTTTNNEPWKLSLAVLDVARADLLSDRSAMISRKTHATLKSVLSESGLVASEVRAALEAGRQRWQSIRGRRTVALLALVDAEEVEVQLARTLEASTKGSSPWRVCLPRPTGPTATEAEMMLLGLIEYDPAAWDHLADAYVWGHLKRGQRGSLDLTYWDGRGEPQMVSVIADSVGERDVVLTKLVPVAAAELAKVLRAEQNAPKADGVRARIARTLVEQATALRHARTRWSRSWETVDLQVRADALQQVRLLETACLFDPQNPVARELLLRVGWNPGTEYAAANRFWFLFKRSEAWGDYVERFEFAAVPSPSLQGVGPELDATPTAAAYFGSARRLVEMARDGNKEQFGFPRDMTGAVASKWLAGFTAELARRAIRTAGQPETRKWAGSILKDGLTGNPGELMKVEPKLRRRCIEALWPAFVEGIPPGSRAEDFPMICQSIKATFLQLGLAGGEADLLKGLNKPKHANPHASVPLPRSAE